jgi:hypothetical protein
VLFIYLSFAIFATTILRTLLYMVETNAIRRRINRPGDPIRSVDPIVFNRIRVGFHRKPTSFIKNRSNPARILSEFDGIR